MFRRLIPVGLVVLVLSLFCGTLGVLFWKSQEAPVVFGTAGAQYLCPIASQSSSTPLRSRSVAAPAAISTGSWTPLPLQSTKLSVVFSYHMSSESP